MTPFTVLVVEDFEPFRRVIGEALRSRPGLKIVGEAVDGLEAVCKASELQPDLILIDIGLPKLNGIEAARQIRNIAPRAKLLFLSMQSSSSTVREAFRAGAAGYIDKVHAHRDLLPGVNAVLNGSLFVGTDLSFDGSFEGRSPHTAQFYSDDAAFVATAVSFITPPLIAGNAAIVIATKPHRDGIAERLSKEIDLDVAVRRGIYVALDPAPVLAELTSSGPPSRTQIFDGFGGVIESAVKASTAVHPHIVLFGECADLLCSLGKAEVAMRVENVANDLAKTYSMEIRCAYRRPPQRQRADEEFAHICAEHDAVLFA